MGSSSHANGSPDPPREGTSLGMSMLARACMLFAVSNIILLSAVASSGSARGYSVPGDGPLVGDKLGFFDKMQRQQKSSRSAGRAPGL